MLNSIVVILRSIATKNPYSCLFHKYRLSGGRAAASRSGGPQTSGCRRACPAGCGRPTPTALLCHPERSESTNAASAETACGLCQARRRETNEMQSRIYSEQGYRCFAALNMTVAAALRKEVNDKRSAVKNLSTYTFIQILRRSAPQNDKLLNCSQTPPQTGISNWRQRE